MVTVSHNMPNVTYFPDNIREKCWNISIFGTIVGLVHTIIDDT